MARRIGSWWIKDGLDGRRIEAQGFGSLLDGLSQFDWSQDHGDSNVVEKDFVDTSNYVEKSDEVDAIMMSSHGSPSGFSVSDGSVSTSDSVSFGKGDLEFFATHACQLLRHTSSNSVGRWIPAFERLHYMFGFHTNSFSGGGRDSRGSNFAMYAAFLYYGIPFIKLDFTEREAWRIANELVEGSNVEWAYLRATGTTSSGTSANTYNERFRANEPADPTHNRTFWTARGTC